MPKQVNHTSITLIPKVPNANKLKLFRPISYCIVLYKLISKVLASRMNPCMSHLIDYA